MWLREFWRALPNDARVVIILSMGIAGLLIVASIAM